MASQEHLKILSQGVEVWNRWREDNPNIRPDLSGNYLIGDLEGVNLSGASLVASRLDHSFLIHADLQRADLRWANLYYANCQKANFMWASLYHANLTGTILTNANLENTSLSCAILEKTNLKNAYLANCLIYGISVWNVELEGAMQYSLIITEPSEPTITVDNLEVAQLIYLLLNNKKIRDVIDTIASKVVLILGRFTPERKVALDSLRDELRKRNYSPVLFDFEKPASRDLTETVSILAHLARFIIVDLTDPSSAPHEVATVIPHIQVPVQPLLWREPLVVDGKPMERREYAMFEDLRRRHHWVLPTIRYQDTAELLASLQSQIIAPAEQKAKELIGPK